MQINSKSPASFCSSYTDNDLSFVLQSEMTNLLSNHKILPQRIRVSNAQPFSKEQITINNLLAEYSHGVTWCPDTIRT
jgi:hypothetical protein